MSGQTPDFLVSGDPAASFARHRTITDRAHARALRGGRVTVEPVVEIRPLTRSDALIA